MAAQQQTQHGKQLRRRREFTTEFRRDAVGLVRTSGRPVTEIARELGIWDSTLGIWGSTLGNSPQAGASTLANKPT